MRILFVSATLALLVSLALSGCGAKEAAELSAPATEAKTKPDVEVRSDWQKEWEQVVREAKKEGQVVIYAAFTSPVRIALTKEFKQKYGIDLDVTIGRTAEIDEKVTREDRAGLRMADVFISGRSLGYSFSEQKGLFSTLEPLLLLPEVKDPQVWWQKKLPHLEDKTTLAFATYVQSAITINTDMVKKGELSSMRDILNPRWKGKITMNDPSVGGGGQTWFAVFSELLGYDFMRSLAKMEMAFTADRRLEVEWIARGKYPLGLATMEEMVAELIASGAPLDNFILKEGSYLTYGAGVVAVLTKAPHPNGARLFLNWLLSREGGTVFSKASGSQSAREDVPTDHIPPIKVRQPGGKYVLEDVSLRPEKQRMMREIFGPLLK